MSTRSNLLILTCSFALGVFTHAQQKDSSKETTSPFVAKHLQLTYENFSLPLDKAANLQRQHHSDQDLYHLIVKKVAKKTATQETLTIISTAPSTPSIIEEISEQIYPTEWEPSILPGGELPETSATPTLPESIIPSSFETKNVGLTLEVTAAIVDRFTANGEGAKSLIEKINAPTTNPFEDPIDEVTQEQIIDAISKNQIHYDQIIELDLQPTLVFRAQDHIINPGKFQISKPNFEIQRLRTQLRLKPFAPTFLGTMTPPPSSKIHSEEKRVWFTFITAKIKSLPSQPHYNRTDK